MSRLISKLGQISKGMPKPMGFTAMQGQAVKARMALVMYLTDLEDAGSLDVSGADAVILSSGKPPSRSILKIAGNFRDTPWGACLKDSSGKDLDSLAQAGADFAVFSLSSRVSSADMNNKLGKLLEVPASLADSLLRVLNDLPADALIIDSEPDNNPLTWERLLQLQRFAPLSKPLLALLPAELSPAEIKAVWTAGIDGIVFRSSPDQAASKIKGLSDQMQGLSLPPRRRGRAEALLPHLRPEPEPPPEEEGEGE